VLHRPSGQGVALLWASDGQRHGPAAVTAGWILR
jgi:hypothetical protein